MEKGMLVAFEGIDGTGKSTNCRPWPIFLRAKASR